MKITRDEAEQLFCRQTILQGRGSAKQMLTNALCDLVEYKHIEEELGVDLFTLVKALKEGFYYKALVAGHPDEIWFANPDKEECGIEYYSDGRWGITWAGLGVALTNDYGSVWALTEEEIKNDD